MAYEEKTDWLPDDPINEDDVNRWEKGIKDAHTDLATHKNDMNNPHNTTKAQVGLGNVDNVQQASKAEFNEHNNDSSRHITSTERSNWNAKETPAGSQSKADTAERNAKAYTDELAARRDNPNQVTKAQVGLGNVDNVQQASKAEFNSHTNDSIRHITSDERTKWDNSQLFKITADNGTQKINLTSGSFYEALKDLGSVSFYGTKAVTDNPSDTSLRGMQLVGQPGIGIGYAVDVGGNAWWFYYNADHTALNWAAIESTGGAQLKVIDHAEDKILHITSSERTKWNGAQLTKITADHGGVTIAANEGEDILQKIVDQGRSMGTFYSHGKAINSPSPYSIRGVFHLTSLSTDGKGMFGWVHATDYRNNFFTNYWDGNTGGWQGWKRLITPVDLNSMTWYDLTLINGNKVGGRKPQYAVWGNQVFTRGEVVSPDFNSVFAILPAEARPSTQKSMAATLFGTTGTSKYIAETNGELRLVGKHANIEANISGVSLDNNFTL